MERKVIRYTEEVVITCLQEVLFHKSVVRTCASQALIKF